ncbi:MAG: hypothetical protein NT007_07400 [Candidatus Kapabacteria bacterium]|nr:hypothetical protein [Candidatus Kapabacteria bacterium]
MKKIITVFLLISFIFTAYSYAEKLTFKILAVRGEVAMQKFGSSNWTQANAGMDLFAKDKIRVSTNGYVGLSYSMGGTKELKNPGEYNCAELSNEMTEKRSKQYLRFSEYIIKEISNIDDLTKKNVKTGASGAVERKLDDTITQLSEIKSNFPVQTNISNAPIDVKWLPIANNKKYKITLKDKKGQLNREFISEEPSFNINTEELKLKTNQIYSLTIEASDVNNIHPKTSSFKLVSKEEAILIDKELKKLQTELGKDSNSALGNLIVGRFYEERKLILNALESYKAGIQAERGVAEYEKLYKNFLLNNQIDN